MLCCGGCSGEEGEREEEEEEISLTAGPTCHNRKGGCETDKWLPCVIIEVEDE